MDARGEGGLPNLWKVDASGGWPLKLTQSDDRQNAAWSHLLNQKHSLLAPPNVARLPGSLLAHAQCGTN